MKRLWRNNGLSITLMGLFLIFQLGLSIVGQQQYNQEQQDHQQPTVSYREYIAGPAFLEATMESWESKFLQMFAYVLLTASLFQKGSSESKDPDKEEAVDRDPWQFRDKPNAPWPVRWGGIFLTLYQSSLATVLFLLFGFSFVLHAVGGAKEYTQQKLEHGGQAVTILSFLGTSEFWSQSLQNWQSEFFSIGVMVLISIVLRHKGSPESKLVDSPHAKTGNQ